MTSLDPVDSKEILTKLLERYAAVWEGYEGKEFLRKPDAACHLLEPSTDLVVRSPLPAYLKSPRRFEVTNMARFRLGSHSLEVARGRQQQVPWANRTCKRCSPEYLATLECKVDDEFHAIFECEYFESLRVDEPIPFQGVTTVKAFMC